MRRLEKKQEKNLKKMQEKILIVDLEKKKL